MKFIFTASFSFLLFFSTFAAAKKDAYEAAVQSYENGDVETAYIHVKNTLQDSPDNLPAKLLLAAILFDKQLYAQAESELLNTLAMGGDVNLIVELLGNSLLRQGKYDDALHYLDNKSLTPDSQNKYTLIVAKAYQGLGRFNDAEKRYQSIITGSPDYIDANLGLASVYIMQRRFELVDGLLTKLEIDHENNPKLWMLKGALAAERQMPKEALTYFLKSSEINPDNMASMRGVANSYIALEQHSKALSIISTILEKAPYDLQGQLLKSSVEKAINSPQAANDTLKDLTSKLSALDQSFILTQPQLLLIDAMTSYSLENWEQANKKFNLYLRYEKNEVNIQAVVLLADVYQKLNKKALAIELLEKHQEKILENKEFGLILAVLYLQSSRTFEAHDLLTSLRSKFNDDTDVLLLSAKALIDLKRHQDAFDLLAGKNIDESLQYIHLMTVLHYQLNQYQPALEQSEKLISNAPTNVEYALLHATVLLANKQIASAENIFTGLYTKYPNQQSVKENYMFFNVQYGDGILAKKLLSELMTEYPDVERYWLQLSALEQSFGNTNEAISILEGQLDKASHSSRLMLSQKLADLSFGNLQHRKSLTYLATLLAEDRLNERALSLSAKNHIALRDLEKAKEVINLLVVLWSENPVRLLELSKMQQSVEDFKAAKNSIQSALKMSPEATPLIIEMVKIHILSGEYSEADSWLNRVDKDNSEWKVTSLVLSGDIAAARNNLHQAFDLFSQALTFEPENSVPLIKMTQLASLKDFSSKYSNTLSNLLNKNASLDYMRHKLADHLMYLEQFDESRYHYQLLLTKNIPGREKAIILNNLSNILIKTKEYDGAIRFSKQALDLLEVAPLLDTHGWALASAGQYKEGLGFLREAYSRNASNLETQYHLGFTLIKLNRLEEGVKFLRSIIKANSNSSEAKLATNLLQGMSISNK